MNSKKNSAIIFGCNGYLGKHLWWFLESKGWRIYAYDIQDKPILNSEFYRSIDITDKNLINSINTEVDFIFFFSGLTGTSKGFDEFESYIDINEKGLMNLLDKIRKDNSKAKIIFPSTRLVYKGKEGTNLNEEAENEFKTLYALNKWFGEQIIKLYSNYFDLDYYIFRIGVPYGNLFHGDYSYGTVGFFITRAKEERNIILYGEGMQKRTFTHVNDICLQIFETISCEFSRNQIFNVEGEMFSIREISQKIASKFGVQIECSYWPNLEAKMESGDTVFESSKIRKFLKSPLKHNFDQWLNEI